MRKNIKNYTTEINPTKTINEIQALLAAKGAQKVMIDYVDRQPVAIAFMLKSPRGVLPIRMPARIEKLEHLLHGIVPQGREAEQARRTGWRNIKDWIDAQLALIETEMVSMDEVFLPYTVIGDQTLYEKLQSGTLKLNAG